MATDARTAGELRSALTAGGLDATGLSAIGVRPGLGEYLRQLWGRRHFIWYDSRQRTATSNSGHLLGNLWLSLRPLLDALFYFIIFGLVLDMSRGMENFPAFLIIGLMFFRSTATALSSGSAIIRNNKAMIRAFMFPRASIPVSPLNLPEPEKAAGRKDHTPELEPDPFAQLLRQDMKRHRFPGAVLSSDSDH